ncbi:hypothetical protein BGW80DRAFT_1356165 [Lactifluus volemus]|nr:hypothetical protein BGW80DRAFT_1356165 [Lactifluus volemus]
MPRARSGAALMPLLRSIVSRSALLLTSQSSFVRHAPSSLILLSFTSLDSLFVHSHHFPQLLHNDVILAMMPLCGHVPIYCLYCSQLL